ncbi:hypothetical protein BGW80DRAFT_1414499 [Lactifluus volemus]|nr:hypothetical protein BGW80DRAFT_1414499 [Lactifluus volemus]
MFTSPSPAKSCQWISRACSGTLYLLSRQLRQPPLNLSISVPTLPPPGRSAYSPRYHWLL